MSAPLKFLQQPAVYLPLLAGVLFSLIANLLGWDQGAQACFYEVSTDHWTGRDMPLMVALYEYGVLPALILGVGGLLVWLAGYYLKEVQALRKVSFYLFAVLALGNGILANFLLKGYWGRPRPAQVDLYGGTQAFEPSLWIDLASTGKSFPCGHATMGFYFFALALLLQGAARRVVLALALLFGGVIGLSRMSYGGHFLTDVIWAGILMWLVAYGLQQALGLQHDWRYTEHPPHNAGAARRRRFVRLALLPIVLVLLLLVATRSPRDKTDHLSLEASGASLYLDLDLRGELKFEKGAAGTAMEFITRGQGFGFPKTKLHLESESGATPDRTRVYHRVRGFFSDLQASTRIRLPTGHRYEIQLHPKRLEGLRIEDKATEVSPILTLDWRGLP
ncbi:MAG: phosphatase PAP2 family protein [Opitutales bacterium]